MNFKSPMSRLKLNPEHPNANPLTLKPSTSKILNSNSHTLRPKALKSRPERLMRLLDEEEVAIGSHTAAEIPASKRRIYGYTGKYTGR